MLVRRGPAHDAPLSLFSAPTPCPQRVWTAWQVVLPAYPMAVLVELAGPTRGAAETVLRGLEALRPEQRRRPVMLVDGDTFYTHDIVSRFRRVAASRRNAVFCFEDTHPEPRYSYVKLRGEVPYVEAGPNAVAAVKEKVKISDLANTGCYCFWDGDELARECGALIEAGTMQLSQDQKGEFYTSGIIAAMLARGAPFEALRLSSDEFHVLGTPKQVAAFCARWRAQPKARVCFDLDNTLVTAPRANGDYTTCEPIARNVAACRRYKEQGHYIIIATARRMRTHRGSVPDVIADIGQLTRDQLAGFGIPYDELVFGKPWASCYIDDLAVDPMLGDLDKQLGFYPTPHACQPGEWDAWPAQTKASTPTPAPVQGPRLAPRDLVLLAAGAAAGWLAARRL